MGSPLEADYSTVSLEEESELALFCDPTLLEEEINRLEVKMLDAATALQFEKAAEYRDRISYLRKQAVLY